MRRLIVCCWWWVKPDGELQTKDGGCYSEESAVQFQVSFGASRFGSSALGSGGGLAVLSSFTLGRHYDGAGGTGSSISIVGSSCTGGYWNTPSAWDNRISSSYNGCAQLKHWDLPYTSGTVESTFGAGTTDNLGFMNNRTESVSYHPWPARGYRCGGGRWCVRCD